MPSPTIALMSGSIRRGSVHRRLASVLADELRARGVEPDLVDLADFPMPIYHGDDEAESGAPPAARELHDRLGGHDGLIVLSPEYNGGPSALLKNAIDWLTRVDREMLRRLLVGFAAASPGGRGAAHGLHVMRQIGEHLRLALAEDDLSIAHSGEAFEAAGEGWRAVRDDDRERIGSWVDRYVATLAARGDDGGGGTSR